MRYSIRRFEPGDIDGVVSLLAASFASWSGQDSLQFFKWKHLDGPLGPSSMWIAETEGRLVAFRAAMPWQFRRGEEVVRAVRGADAVTHRDHRRQGLWRDMTDREIDTWPADGLFAFAHGNDKTRSGYCSIGWKDIGRLTPFAAIYRPMSVVKMRVGQGLGRRKPCPSSDLVPIVDVLRSGIIDTLSAQVEESNADTLTTMRSREYLDWRYAQLPERDMRALVLRDGETVRTVAIGELKAGPESLSFRVDEILSRPDAPRVRSAVHSALRRAGIQYAIMLPQHKLAYLTWPPKMPLHKRQISLVVKAYGEVAKGPLSLESLSAWQFSLGDLETYF